MIVSYLALALPGKNAWWRYLVSFLGIAFFWQVIGAIPLLLFSLRVMYDHDPATDVDLATLTFKGVGSLIPYLLINFTIIALLAGLWLGVRFLHQRPLLTLITPLERISWKRLLQGGGVFFLLTALATAAEMLLSPDGFAVTFKAREFWVFLPIALLVTPLQAAAEELLFRGYIMQGIGLLTRRPAIPVLGSSLLFMLAHLLNPEAQQDHLLVPLLYFSLGLFLALLAVKDNSLELSIGVHAANNLFSVLVMNYAHSALPSPSIFVALELDPLGSLISFWGIAALFYWLVFYRFKR